MKNAFLHPPGRHSAFSFSLSYLPGGAAVRRGAVGRNGKRAWL